MGYNTSSYKNNENNAHRPFSKKAKQLKSLIMKFYITVRYFLLLSCTLDNVATFANETPDTTDNSGADYYRLVYENDLFLLGDDEGYTHGTLWSWGYNDLADLNDEILPSWIDYLFDKTYLKAPDNQYSLSYTIGQLIQTPTDFENPLLIADDLPYVSLAAWQVKVGAFTKEKKDELSLLIGMVGPVTLGDDVQKNIHKLIGSPAPLGWDHQINNEAVFQLKADRTCRLLESNFETTQLDILTGAGGSLWNYRSETGAGIGIRWGQELAKNFSSASVFSRAKFNNITISPHGCTFLPTHLHIMFSMIYSWTEIPFQTVTALS